MQVENFVNGLQPVTKIVLLGSLLVGGLVSLRVLPPQAFVMNIPEDLKNPVKYFTSLFFIPGIKMNTIMNLMFFYNTNNFLEQHYLPNRYGEYLFLLCFVLLLNYVG